MRANPTPQTEPRPADEPGPIRVPVLGREFTIHRLDGRIVVNGRQVETALFPCERKIWLADPKDPDLLIDQLACALAVAFGIERERKIKARRAARERRRQAQGGRRAGRG